MPHEASIDFKKINTEIILNAFKHLGIQAEASGRNDILVDGKKVINNSYLISSSAYSLFKNKSYIGLIILIRF